MAYCRTDFHVTLCFFFFFSSSPPFIFATKMEESEEEEEEEVVEEEEKGEVLEEGQEVGVGRGACGEGGEKEELWGAGGLLLRISQPFTHPCRGTSCVTIVILMIPLPLSL